MAQGLTCDKMKVGVLTFIRTNGQKATRHYRSNDNCQQHKGNSGLHDHDCEIGLNYPKSLKENTK